MIIFPFTEQIAERGTQQLRLLNETSAEKIWSWRLEEAHAYWDRGENETAKHLMKEIIKKVEKVLQTFLAGTVIPYGEIFYLFAKDSLWYPVLKNYATLQFVLI